MRARRLAVAWVFVAVGVVGITAALVGSVVAWRLLAGLDEATATAVESSRRTADTVDDVLALVGAVSRFVEQFGGSSPLPADPSIDRGLIDAAEQTVDEQLGVARILVVVGGLLVASTQLVPLLLGWALLDVGRVRRLLELPDPVGPTPRSASGSAPQ